MQKPLVRKRKRLYVKHGNDETSSSDNEQKTDSQEEGYAIGQVPETDICEMDVYNGNNNNNNANNCKKNDQFGDFYGIADYVQNKNDMLLSADGNLQATLDHNLDFNHMYALIAMKYMSKFLRLLTPTMDELDQQRMIVDTLIENENYILSTCLPSMCRIIENNIFDAISGADEFDEQIEKECCEQIQKYVTNTQKYQDFSLLIVANNEKLKNSNEYDNETDSDSVDLSDNDEKYYHKQNKKQSKKKKKKSKKKKKTPRTKEEIDLTLISFLLNLTKMRLQSLRNLFNIHGKIIEAIFNDIVKEYDDKLTFDNRLFENDKQTCKEKIQKHIENQSSFFTSLLPFLLLEKKSEAQNDFINKFTTEYDELIEIYEFTPDVMGNEAGDEADESPNNMLNDVAGGRGEVAGAGDMEQDIEL